MEISLFLAKFFGLYFLITALLWVFRKDQVTLSVNEMLSSRGLLALAGFLALLLGLGVVLIHPVYELSWRGLITALGYLSIVKGVIRIGFPEKDKAITSYLMDKGRHWIIVAVAAVLGVYLAAHGFHLNVF